MSTLVFLHLGDSLIEIDVYDDFHAESHFMKLAGKYTCYNLPAAYSCVLSLLVFLYKRLATVRQMPEFYSSFTQSSIRWLILNKKSNCFDKCVRRIGRKVLIDLDSFEKLIDEQNKTMGE